MTILTIGYQRMTPQRLKEIVYGLKGILVDVRLNPRSRKPGFSQGSLHEYIGAAWYKPAGHMLGGRGHTTGEGIIWLRSLSKLIDEPLILLCMEEAPGECHRHGTICGPHFPDALHIYQDQILTARALEEAQGDEYEIEDFSLSDLLSGKHPTINQTGGK